MTQRQAPVVGDVVDGGLNEVGAGESVTREAQQGTQDLLCLRSQAIHQLVLLCVWRVREEGRCREVRGKERLMVIKIGNARMDGRSGWVA